LEKASEKNSSATEDAVKQMASLQGSGGTQAAALQALLGPLLSQAFGSSQSPTLRSLLAGRPATIASPGRNLRETGLMMTEARKAALIVDDGELVGIFGFKDMMTRAIAKELPLELTAVSSVMTPNPEAVSPDTTVVEALQIMHDNKFLTLPVCEDNGVVVGLVDVMDLIYGCGGAEGWRSIFGSAMDVADDGSETNSVSSFDFSKKLARVKNVTAVKKVETIVKVALPPKLDPINSRDMNVPFHVSVPDDGLNDTFDGSFIEEMQSFSRNQIRPGFNDGMSSVAMSNAESQVLFKVIDSSGNTYRIRCDCNYERLLASISNKMSEIEPGAIEVKFIDDEGDAILIRDDECLSEAVTSSKESGAQATKLSVSRKKSEKTSADSNDNILIMAGAGVVLLVGLFAMIALKPKK